MNNVDGAGADEEDRYGAVVRSSNAYVPPGARKQAPLNGPAAAAATKPAAPDLPRVAVNAPDGSALSPRVQTPASSGSGSGSASASGAAGTSKAPSPAPTAANSKVRRRAPRLVGGRADRLLCAHSPRRTRCPRSATL